MGVAHETVTFDVTKEGGKQYSIITPSIFGQDTFGDLPFCTDVNVYYAVFGSGSDSFVTDDSIGIIKQSICDLSDTFTMDAAATTNLLMQLLVDNYNDNSPNYSLWGATLSGFEIYEQNQRIEIYCDHTGHGYLWSVDNYCIRNSSMYIHLEAVPVSPYLLMDFFLTDPDGPSVGFALFNGNLHIYNGIYSVYSEAFNGTNHQYLRIRGDLTNIYFEVSSDCKTWNSFYSLTNAESGINADNVYPTFGAGTTDYVADLEYVAFDSFNIQEFTGTCTDRFSVIENTEQHKEGKADVADTLAGEVNTDIIKSALAIASEIMTVEEAITASKTATVDVSDDAEFVFLLIEERFIELDDSVLFTVSASPYVILKKQNDIIAELDIKKELRKVF